MTFLVFSHRPVTKHGDANTDAGTRRTGSLACGDRAGCPDRLGYVRPLIGREPVAYSDCRSLVLLLGVLAAHSVWKRARKRYV